jgi:hypothetical protein
MVNMWCWAILNSPCWTQDEEITHKCVECDYVRVVVTSSTGLGKDQDLFLHNSVFEFVIQFYRGQLSHLKRIIIWTDRCKGQYKCQQSFSYLAYLGGLYIIEIVHRFAATARFKGIHDMIGASAPRMQRDGLNAVALRPLSTFDSCEII